jgi:hypothetical protein
MVKKAIIFILLIFLFLLLFLVVYFVQKQTSITGKASGPGEPSLENSYLFASPLYASSGGVEKIRVTVFVLDSQGSGVSGRSVILGQSPNLISQVLQNTTDAYGKAIFDTSSTTPGEYIIEVAVDNQTLSQKLRISFR